ncbi:MAG: hypothetical protein WDM76_16130 [Limisphaerales bacterium]
MKWVIKGTVLEFTKNFAYVVDGGANLHIFDVSNPARPVEVNRIGTENFCSKVLSLTDYTAGKSPMAVFTQQRRGYYQCAAPTC